MGHFFFLNLGFGLFALAHQLADGLTAGVAFLAQRLDFLEQLPPLPVEFQNFVNRRVGIQISRRFDLVRFSRMKFSRDGFPLSLKVLTQTRRPGREISSTLLPGLCLQKTRP
jgi:hypothetical protein